ncbi:cytochrome P450 2J1, partial [Biomphalaria pfeifferi]
CVLSFPLEECDMKKLHLRFVVDCRDDIEEQMSIFHQTQQFFITYRNWSIPEFTLMTYSHEGIYQIQNVTDVEKMNQTCPDNMTLEFIANQSLGWDENEDRSYSLLPLIGFNKFNSQVFYSKLCYSKCDPRVDSFKIENFLISSYNNSESSTMSSNEAGQFCAGKKGAYLVSLETSEELEFIFEKFGQQGFALHIGLRVETEGTPQWASSNPFTLKYNYSPKYTNKEKRKKIKKSRTKIRFPLHYTSFNDDTWRYLRDNVYTYQEIYYDYEIESIPHLKKCFFISKENKYVSEKILHTSLSSTGVFHISNEDCDKKIENSLALCECHFPISMNQISMETRETGDTFVKEKYISDFRAMISSQKNSFQLINCHHPMNSSNHSGAQNVCSKYVPHIVQLHPNVTSDWLNMLLKAENGLNILRTVNISSCTFRSQKQQNCLKNISSCKHCLDDWDTSVQRPKSIKANLNTFNCESSGTAYQCIQFATRSVNCIDNSHLQQCERFICPPNFMKCLNSFCIQRDMINDNVKDCPHGEDEIDSPKNDTVKCFGNVTAYVKDLCLSNLYPHKVPSNQYHCSPACPENYTCFSNRRLVNSTMSIDIYTFRFPVYVSSDLYFSEMISAYFPILNTISISVQNCKIENFDSTFKNWRLSNLQELDLSFNDFKSSNNMSLFHDMIKLTFLNLSNNPRLRINQNFTFPENLESLDLSHTSFKSIRGNTFLNLKRLKYLDLSTTRVVTFKDLGIPTYYTLDTLYLKNVTISQIRKDFFKGLTIRTGLWTMDFRLCCPQILNANISVHKCHGPADAISSCNHLIGDVLKRLVIWIVGIITIVGNGIVLIYRFVWNREVFKKAYGLFVTGLALSDFLMGIYLMIIASVDIGYKDTYVLEEIKWRNGTLCQISGFLSTLSSETSTFFICLITLDRYLSINYPFGEYKLTKTWTRILFTLAWSVGIVLAAIPLVISSWKIYSTNGLCLALPFSSIRFSGWKFTIVVYVGVNFVLFLLIAFGQVAIFVNITRRKQSMPSLKKCPKRRLEDLAVARKLAFVAMSDFLCWFPIGIIGIFSMKGHTFDSDVYAWFAVFVLPINSALNPVIYTIPTLYAKCKPNQQNTTKTNSSQL